MVSIVIHNVRRISQQRMLAPTNATRPALPPSCLRKAQRVEHCSDRLEPEVSAGSLFIGDHHSNAGIFSSIAARSTVSIICEGATFRRPHNISRERMARPSPAGPQPQQSAAYEDMDLGMQPDMPVATTPAGVQSLFLTGPEQLTSPMSATSGTQLLDPAADMMVPITVPFEQLCTDTAAHLAAGHLLIDSSSLQQTHISSSKFNGMDDLDDLLGPIPQGSWDLSQQDARGALPLDWGPSRCLALDDSAASAASMVHDTDHGEQRHHEEQGDREAGGGAVQGLEANGAPARRSLQDMLYEARLYTSEESGCALVPRGGAGQQQLPWDRIHPRTVTSGWHAALRTPAAEAAPQATKRAMAGKQKGAPKSKRRKGAQSDGCRPAVCSKPYDDHHDDDAPACILSGERRKA